MSNTELTANPRYMQPASGVQIERAAQALAMHVAANATTARAKFAEGVPAGAEAITGASTTLIQLHRALVGRSPTCASLARRPLLLLALGLGLLLAAAPALAGPAPTPLQAAAAPTWHPAVAGIIAGLQAADVYTAVAELSGQQPTLIDGVPYTLTTRHSRSGLPLQKATRYVAERLEAVGIAVATASWTACGFSGTNLTGIITGTVYPDEIVLMTAHLDDMPSSGTAPGADDNASGVAAVLLAGRQFARVPLARTVRLVFFTGEEQGLCGSGRYAEAAQAAGDNLVAVYNVDMLGWDSVGAPVAELHTRVPTDPGYAADLAIASVFTNVVALYNLGDRLEPVIRADGPSAADHSSFWNYGFPAILAIEDSYNDFNAYYHTTNDGVNYLNLDYLTAFVQASAGTVAHLAAPVRALYFPVVAR